MNRFQFLKKLAIGIPAVLLAPEILSFIKPKKPEIYYSKAPDGKIWTIIVESCVSY